MNAPTFARVFPSSRILIFGLALLAGLTVTVGPSSAASSTDTPSGFSDVFESALASDGNQLWLATTGRSGDEPMRSQVLAYRGGKWKQLGSRVGTVSGYAINLVARKRRKGKGSDPCFADTAEGPTARLRCFEQGRWISKQIAKPLQGMTFRGLRADGRRLTGAFYDWKGTGNDTVTTVRAAKLVGSTFKAVGKPVILKGQYWANIVQSTRSSRSRNIAVAIRSANSSDRWIQTIGPSGSSKGRVLKGLVEGSQGSAPVRDGSSVYFPVNQDYGYVDDSGRVPTLSVYRYHGRSWSEVGGEPVSNDYGFAQGSVNPVGGRVWAVWQENDASNAEFGEAFPTKVFAARVSEDGKSIDRELELWNGEIRFPGETQAVSYRGRPVFLYNQEKVGRMGIQATVDFTHANGR